MTTTPEPPPAHDAESGTADDRFDRRIAFGVVAALAVAAAVGPFGWHLLSNAPGGSSASAGAAAVLGGGSGGAGSGGGIGNIAAGNGGGVGGAGSNGIAAAAPAAESSSPSPATSANPANPATQQASASCAAALGNGNSVPGTTGTSAAIGAWSVTATPSVNALRATAANLHGIVIRQDPTAIPASAKGLCDEVGNAGQLAPMPDTVGATAWQAALSAYAAGATDALAATNHPAYFQAAQAQLAQGEQELDALSARITAAAQH